MRAVSVRLNDVVGVGGFVLPGDRVDVLYTRNSNTGDGVSSSTDILIQNVRVLAIDQVADQKQSNPLVAKVATIEVTTLDAQKVALAQTTGSLSLTLRSAGSLDRAAAQRVVEEELVSSPSRCIRTNSMRAPRPRLRLMPGSRDLKARSPLSRSASRRLPATARRWNASWRRSNR